MWKKGRDAGGPRRRQTLQLDSSRRSSNPAPWEEHSPSSDGPTWQEVTDPSTGDVYYWNVSTGATTWDRPPELGPPTSAKSPAVESSAASAEVKKTNPNALSALGGYDSEEEHEKEAAAAGSTKAGAGDAGRAEGKQGEKVSPATAVSSQSSDKNAGEVRATEMSRSREEEKQKETTTTANDGGGGGGGVEGGAEGEVAAAGEVAKESTASASKHDADLDDFLAELDSTHQSSGSNATEDEKKLPSSAGAHQEVAREAEGGGKMLSEEEDAGGINGEESASKEEQLVTSNMERACMEIVGLKKKGDILIDRLKKNIAEEEHAAGGRRDVLLTLLGGLLSWVGIVTDLGIMMSDSMSPGCTETIIALLPKLHNRFNKCEAEVSKQEGLRVEEGLEVMPEGWVKACDVSSRSGKPIYCNLGKNLFSRSPPAGTKLEKIVDRHKEEAKAKAEAKKGHERVISSLPAGEGETRKDTLLLYVQPEAACTVPFVRDFFADRSLLVIRVIGSGFAAVTFSSGMECELARDEALAVHRGIISGQPPLREWTVLQELKESERQEKRSVYARCATSGENIDKYPIHFSQNVVIQEIRLDAKEKAAARSAPTSLDDKFGPPAIALATTKAAVRGKVKMNSHFSNQILKWKQKQEELEPEEEEAMSIEVLEEEKKRKAEEWYAEQMSSSSSNPNLIPLAKRPKM